MLYMTYMVCQVITEYVRGDASCGGRHLFVDIARFDTFFVWLFVVFSGVFWCGQWLIFG